MMSKFKILLKTFVLIVSLSGVISCAHKSPVFKTEKDRQVHIASGVNFPQQFPHWYELSDSIKENISPEILASVGYQYVADNMAWKPSAALYILRNKSTSNLKLVENQVVNGLQEAVFVKTEAVTIKKKKKILLSIYNHEVPWTSTSGSGVKNLKVFHNQSLFATPEKDSQKVVWLIVNRETPGWKELAYDFFERALFQPEIDAAPAATASSPSKKEKPTISKKAIR